jgi:hypothetical protein
MSVAAVESIAQQIEQLDPEDKWTLLSLLVESLHRQTESADRCLSDYYGIGKGRGFQTAQEVDTYIRKERAAWEE